MILGFDEDWNLVSSCGAVIAIVGIIWFLYLSYEALAAERPFEGWSTSPGSLEWSLSSPPDFRTYNELLFVYKRKLSHGMI